MRRALITGITGQDGSYLAELLLDKGYEVHGMVRPSSPPASVPSRIAHLCTNPAIYNKRLFLHSVDFNHAAELGRVVAQVAPDELYHLASQSHAGLSFEMAEATCQLAALGTVRLLEAIRTSKTAVRFFHASSSEIFGQAVQMPQDEETPFAPVTPYGCAKAFATQLTRVYRRSHGLFACNGILYNHESPRKAETFVTRKICRAAAAIKLGLQKELLLGDLRGQRDWGDARDYVRGMWQVLQHSAPEDFLFATGRLHSVQDIVERAFDTVHLDWTQYVRQDPRFLRPAEPQRLVGNAAKAKRLLGWEPQISFEQLVQQMTEADLAVLSKC